MSEMDNNCPSSSSYQYYLRDSIPSKVFEGFISHFDDGTVSKILGGFRK